MEEVDCSEALHRLYHYLDGELTAERRMVIAAHLEICGSCLSAFDFELELRRVLSQKCREQLPPGLLERIAQAIGHEYSQTGETASE
jgi:mycothiol system anti-sigma-R factor